MGEILERGNLQSRDYKVAIDSVSHNLHRTQWKLVEKLLLEIKRVRLYLLKELTIFILLNRRTSNQ